MITIHQEAMDRYNASFAAERDERDDALEDMRFCWVKGSQWTDSANTARNDRPRMEVNKVKLPVTQVLGEQRQDRVDIKVRPVKDGADQERANVLNGLVRSILHNSRFKNIKDQSAKEQVTSGIGGWYVTTQYQEDGFDQDIVIKGIQSAASSIFYDPSATGLMKEDSMWMMVTQDVDRAEFVKRYPDASTADLSSYSEEGTVSWQDRDTIKVADYWVKEPYMKEIALMSDGQIIEVTDETKLIMDELALQGITVVKTRKSESHKVVMYKVSASEILEGPFEWAGKHIPVIPFFGFSVWIQGQHYYQGMVRSAIDAQRIYNYATSAMIEAAALSPKDPYWVTAKQAKGYEGQFENFNNSNTPFMLYNADEDVAGPPQRTGAPSVQTALIQQVQQADMDVQSTTGLFSPSLGNEQHDQSGRAILALQKQGNLGTFELTDNITKAVEYTGEVLFDLIPKIYDTERQVTILGVDGVPSEMILNKSIVDVQTGEEVLLNDLSKGKYSVMASSAPSFESQRAENINILTRLGESNPTIAPLITDLIVKSLDSELSEELTPRVRTAMIKQGLVTPTQEEMQAISELQPEADPMEAIMLEREVLNNELIKAQILDVQAATRKQDSNVMQDQSDQLKTLTDAQKDIASSIKYKVDASETLDNMGIMQNIPLEGELEASLAISNAIDGLTS